MIKELTATDTSSYKNLLRMDSSTFEELLGMMAPFISKQDTLMRKPIPAGERLALTLRFFATVRCRSKPCPQKLPNRSGLRV